MAKTPPLAQRFEALVAPLEGKLYFTCLGLMGNRQDAEDCAQEAILKAFRAFGSFREQSSFSTWLYRVSCNICYDRLRALQHSPAGALSDITFAELPVCSDDNIEATLVNRELKAHILYFMQQLTPKQKLVFTLRDIEELEIKEIEKKRVLFMNKFYC